MHYSDDIMIVSSGSIRLKIEPSDFDQEALPGIFEQALTQQIKHLRHQAAQFLNDVRKKRHLIIEHARHHGYAAGYKKGSKEGTRSFQSTSRHIRAFRKHLEQIAVSAALEVLQQVLPTEKSVQNRIARKVLQELKPRLRDLTFIKCIKNPKSKLASSVIDDIAVHEMPTEFDESIPVDHIKFVTPSGELTLCVSAAASYEVSRLCGKQDHELFC